MISSNYFIFERFCFLRKSFLTNESSVGIIGAGPAGISAAANLLAISKITVFEQASSIGGTWRYNEDPNEEYATSMYKNLKINVPKESMAFPDYPFDKQGDPSFIGHEEVLEYLVKYAEMSKVLPHIKFNAKVTSISRTSHIRTYRTGSKLEVQIL